MASGWNTPGYGDVVLVERFRQVLARLR